MFLVVDDAVISLSPITIQGHPMNFFPKFLSDKSRMLLQVNTESNRGLLRFNPSSASCMYVTRMLLQQASSRFQVYVCLSGLSTFHHI